MKKTQRGQSLFEVILAIAVLTLVLVGIVSLATISVRNSTFSRNKTLASKYAQEASEWLRSERDKDRDAFILHADASFDIPKYYCLDALVWTNLGKCSSSEFISNTPFIRNLSLTKTMKSGKTVIEVKVVVSWQDSQGEHEARSFTYFSDWRER